METEQLTVYEALRQIRPRWLRPGGVRTRMSGQTDNVSVYLGTQRMDGVAFLMTLDPRAVKEIRLYSSSDATTLLGTNNMGGALVITLR